MRRSDTLVAQTLVARELQVYQGQVRDAAMLKRSETHRTIFTSMKLLGIGHKFEGAFRDMMAYICSGCRVKYISIVLLLRA